ncbi:MULTISPECIES: hypothetical protein [unclassified Empedobacter]|uniref:hypothetical protein n=1 Tax=unclassified Empedobacter TaxID=2643773 RepID=UPI0025BCC6DB|nr:MULTISPECIES: hypothetical protein [unclassified Empedobacter]
MKKNTGKIIRVDSLPPKMDRFTNVIYQVSVTGSPTYIDYAIDENGDIKTPTLDTTLTENNFGKVKTVNGQEPNENGNIKVDDYVQIYHSEEELQDILDKGIRDNIYFNHDTKSLVFGHSDGDGYSKFEMNEYLEKPVNETSDEDKKVVLYSEDEDKSYYIPLSKVAGNVKTVDRKEPDENGEIYLGVYTKVAIPPERELNRVLLGDGSTKAQIETRRYTSNNIVGSGIEQTTSSLKIPNIYKLGGYTEFRNGPGLRNENMYGTRVWYAKEMVITTCFFKYGVEGKIDFYSTKTMELVRSVPIKTYLNRPNDEIINVMADIDKENLRIYFVSASLANSYKAIYVYDFTTDAMKEIPGSTEILAKSAGSDFRSIRYNKYTNTFTYLHRESSPTNPATQIWSSYDFDVSNFEDIKILPNLLFNIVYSTAYDDNVSFTKDGVFVTNSQYCIFVTTYNDPYRYQMTKINATSGSFIVHTLTSAGTALAVSCLTGDIWEVYPSLTKPARKLGTLPQPANRLSRPIIDKNNNVYVSTSEDGWFPNIYKFKLEDGELDIQLAYRGDSALYAKYVSFMCTDGENIYFTPANNVAPNTPRKISPIGDNKILGINNKEELFLLDITPEEFIPLTGTEPNKPITGHIELAPNVAIKSSNLSGAGIIINDGQGYNNASIFFDLGDPSNGTLYASTYFSDTSSPGMSGTVLAQTYYVDREVSKAYMVDDSIEPLTLVDFKSKYNEDINKEKPFTVYFPNLSDEVKKKIIFLGNDTYVEEVINSLK